MLTKLSQSAAYNNWKCNVEIYLKVTVSLFSDADIAFEVFLASNHSVISAILIGESLNCFLH